MRIFIFIIIIIFYITLSHSELYSDFEVRANKDSTITYYDSLEESRLQENGYTNGLKSGAFAYLVTNGSTKSTSYIKDTLRYKYGRTNSTGKFVDSTNTSVIHTHVVKFEGEKGISEFYGEGFFKNKRAVSAWKKIWYYDNSDTDGYNYLLGPSYNSSSIDVQAIVSMDTKPGMDYQFTYAAKVKNGYINIKDASSWTNKTGARRIDWEREALLKGEDLFVGNNLSDSDIFVPAAGLTDDWLPCCFNRRPFYADEVWPNVNQYMMFNCSCQDKSAEGISQSIETTSSGMITQFNPSTSAIGGAAIQVKKYLMGIENAPTAGNRSITYMIEVKNVGETKLSNVTATDILPVNMLKKNASAQIYSPTGPEGRLVPSPLTLTESEWVRPDKGIDTTWNMNLEDGLKIDELIRITLKVEVWEGKADPFANRATATGYFMTQPYSNKTISVLDGTNLK
jgi:uncharacterized repeat protein (TIGR01451 family)